MARWLARVVAALTGRSSGGRLRSEIEAIAGSGIFDPTFYTAQLADPARAADPVRDYLERGAREGLDPHPLFDSVWYLERCPELRAAGQAPLLHYLAVGEERGLRPNPLFDPAWYRACHPELAGGGSALAHYLAVGAPRGDAPCALFDPALYARRRRGGLPRGANALAHYLGVGSREGVDPHPLFDSAWYVARHPEVARTRLAPLAHFVACGARAGYSPHPLFDSAWYLERYPDVAEAGANPLEHFMERGAAEERRPHPLFDTAWYRARYPAARRQRGNPLVFFIESGAARGHAPNPFLNPAWYRERHPELGPSWLAATLHFLERRGEPGVEPNPLLRRYAAFFRASEEAPQLADPAQNPLAALLGPPPHGPAPTIELPGSAAPDATLVVPVHERIAYTIPCLRSVAAARTRAPFEVILVDDASPSVDYRELLAHVAGLRVLRNPRNLGFVGSCNRGAAEARGRHLVFLNNDTIVLDDWLDELLATFEKFPRAGIAGSKLLYPSGATGEAGGIVWRDGSGWNYGRRHPPDSPEVSHARPVDYVSGAALAIERRRFLELGGFSEAFAPAYYEDTDLAFRVREAGLQVIYQPASQVIHFEGASSGGAPEGGMKVHQDRHQKVFLERWRSQIEGYGETGQEPDREKDRHYTGRALVVDTATPTPGRDSRSLRSLQLMRILLELGMKVSFVPANANAPDPWRSSLQSHGIRVLHQPWIDGLEGYLAGTLDAFDVCLVSRPALVRRVLARLRSRFPDALCLFDAADLLPLDTPWLRAGAVGTAPPLAEGVAPHATLVAMDPDEWKLTAREERERALYLLPWIYDPGRRPAGFDARRDLFFVAGLQATPTVDALLWCIEGILPRVAREVPDVRLWVAERDWLRGPAALEPCVATLSDAELEDPAVLDRFRVAVAPFRFGPSVHGRLQPALARGLPCVATPCAAQAMPRALRGALALADDADALAEAIARLYREPEAWHAASAASRSSVASIYSLAAASDRVRRILADLGWSPR